MTKKNYRRNLAERLVFCKWCSKNHREDAQDFCKQNAFERTKGVYYACRDSNCVERAWIDRYSFFDHLRENPACASLPGVESKMVSSFLEYFKRTAMKSLGRWQVRFCDPLVRDLPLDTTTLEQSSSTASVSNREPSSSSSSSTKDLILDDDTGSEMDSSRSTLDGESDSSSSDVLFMDGESVEDDPDDVREGPVEEDDWSKMIKVSLHGPVDSSVDIQQFSGLVDYFCNFVKSVCMEDARVQVANKGWKGYGRRSGKETIPKEQLLDSDVHTYLVKCHSVLTENGASSALQDELAKLFNTYIGNRTGGFWYPAETNRSRLRSIGKEYLQGGFSFVFSTRDLLLSKSSPQVTHFIRNLVPLVDDILSSSESLRFSRVSGKGTYAEYTDGRLFAAAQKWLEGLFKDPQNTALQTHKEDVVLVPLLLSMDAALVERKTQRKVSPLILRLGCNSKVELRKQRSMRVLAYYDESYGNVKRARRGPRKNESFHQYKQFHLQTFLWSILDSIAAVQEASIAVGGIPCSISGRTIRWIPFLGGVFGDSMGQISLFSAKGLSCWICSAGASNEYTSQGDVRNVDSAAKLWWKLGGCTENDTTATPEEKKIAKENLDSMGLSFDKSVKPAFFFHNMRLPSRQQVLCLGGVCKLHTLRTGLMSYISDYLERIFIQEAKTAKKGSVLDDELGEGLELHGIRRAFFSQIKQGVEFPDASRVLGALVLREALLQEERCSAQSLEERVAAHNSPRLLNLQQGKNPVKDEFCKRFNELIFLLVRISFFVDLNKQNNALLALAQKDLDRVYDLNRSLREFSEKGSELTLKMHTSRRHLLKNTRLFGSIDISDLSSTERAHAKLSRGAHSRTNKHFDSHIIQLTHRQIELDVLRLCLRENDPEPTKEIPAIRPGGERRFNGLFALYRDEIEKYLATLEGYFDQTASVFQWLESKLDGIERLEICSKILIARDGTDQHIELPTLLSSSPRAKTNQRPQCIAYDEGTRKFVAILFGAFIEDEGNVACFELDVNPFTSLLGDHELEEVASGCCGLVNLSNLPSTRLRLLKCDLLLKTACLWAFPERRNDYRAICFPNDTFASYHPFHPPPDPPARKRRREPEGPEASSSTSSCNDSSVDSNQIQK